MLIFLDYLPIVAFIIAYSQAGIFAATAAIMITMPLVPLAHWLVTRKVSRMHLISTALVLALGSITLIFKNALFIAWKPTVFNWLLSIVCIGSLSIGDKPLIQRLLGHTIQITAPQWRQLTVAWAVFFFVLGAINLFVYYNFAEQTWVYFKLWGLLGMTIVFVVLQSVWLGAIANKNEQQNTGPSS